MPGAPRSPSRPSTAALLAYLGGLVMPAPRVVRFVLGERLRARGLKDIAGGLDAGETAGVPTAKLTPGLVALAALDEWIVAFMKTPGRLPTRESYEVVGREVRAAHELYSRRGWLDDPVSFHAQPPPLVDPKVARRRRPGPWYEHVSFDSGYEPDPDDPGHDRWLSHVPNRTAHAWMLRHPDGEARPWMVCLHAFGMGYPSADLWAFRARWMHRTLGVNVLMPVAPWHGPRRTGRLSGAGFMTYNTIDIVHGFAQAAWDIRRLLSWVRAGGGNTIGVYGVSMGAHVAALVAGLEPDLACVLAAFPTCDLTALFLEHGPRNLRRRAVQHGLLGPEAHAVHRLASPLALPAVVPRERLFVCGGLADRMATPAQAMQLWEHWERPRIRWFNTNHVAFLWSGEVAAFVREVLGTVRVA